MGILRKSNISFFRTCSAKARFDMNKIKIPGIVLIILGEMFDNIIPALIREIVGDEIANWMEVPYSNWQKLMKFKELMGFLDSDYSGVFGSMTNQLVLALLRRQSLS